MTREPAAPRTDRVWPAEVFLARLNAAADTDVTVLLRCDSPTLAAGVAHALTEHGGSGALATVGARARRLEPVGRPLLTLGPLALDPRPLRAGPFDVSRAPGDTTVVVARWSHLAGDARSCQESVLDASTGSMPLVPTTEQHGRPPTTLPGAGAYAIRRTPPVRAARPTAGRRCGGHGGRRQRRPAARLRRRRTPAAPTAPPPGSTVQARGGLCGNTDGDAFAVVALPHPPDADRASGHTRAAPGGTRPSRFARVSAQAAALAVPPGTRSPVRLGVTVDLRRHEPMLAGLGTGNLSLVGWVNLPPEGGRFWRQQLAFDSWAARCPLDALSRATAQVVQRLASRAPICLTELWREDAPRCVRCARPRRRLPAGITQLVIPPALPPAGLTVGITRTARETLVVLRRMTGVGEDASAWTDAAARRMPWGEPGPSGPLRLA